MRDVMGERFGPEFAAVFYTQMQMLEDQRFIQALDQALAPQANDHPPLLTLLDPYRTTFEHIEDPYFRERGADVQDVGQRVAEEQPGRDDVVDAAEAQQRQVAQARPHGGADEERAGGHRHRDTDSDTPTPLHRYTATPLHRHRDTS